MSSDAQPSSYCFSLLSWILLNAVSADKHLHSVGNKSISSVGSIVGAAKTSDK